MRFLLIRGESVITVADSLPKATQPVSAGRGCRGGCLSQSLTTLFFEIRTSLNLETQDWDRLAVMAKLQGSSWVCLSNAGLNKQMPLYPVFPGCWEIGSSPHVCTANTSLTGPSPQDHRPLRSLSLARSHPWEEDLLLEVSLPPSNNHSEA